MNFYRFFSVLFTLSFAVLFVAPVKGQNSFDPTRSTEPGYRFGFGDGREQQVVEQARKNAAQEAAKQGVDLQFQDPAKLRNQIRELGNRSSAVPALGQQEQQKQVGKFYVRPLGDGEAKIPFEAWESQKINPFVKFFEGRGLSFRHEHFYSHDGGYDVGYGPDEGVLGTGIFYENPVEKNGRIKITGGLKERSHTLRALGLVIVQGKRYYVDIMMEAEEILVESRQWMPKSAGKPYGYDLTTHNCQHFARALRTEYDKIYRRMQEVTDELFSLPLINKVINSTDDYIATVKSMDYKGIKDAERKLAALPTKADLERDHCPDDFVDSYDKFVTAINANGVISPSNRNVRTRFENICELYNIKPPNDSGGGRSW